MNIQQPRFVDGRSLAVDLTGAGSSIAGGISKMLDRKRQDEAQQQKQAQFDRANDIYSQTSSFLQIDPANRSMALIESAQQDRVNGNEEDYQEKIRISQMSPDLIEQELMQDFSNASNILGRDPMGGLKQMGIGGGTDSRLPSDVQETIWFNQQPPEVQEQHMKLKRRAATDYAAMAEYQKILADIKAKGAGAKVTAETEAEAESSEQAASTAEKIAAGKATGSGTATRKQGYIDAGIDAVDALANIMRSQQLLNSVETGGFDNAKLWAKQKLGIESADEAELSGRLGKSILAQLKPIFGAAFTAGEGQRLEKIESSFGKSTAGNKRLLQDVFKITERAARRGLEAAKASGDDFTVGEIQAGLDALKDMETDFTLEKSGDVDFSALEAKHGIK